MSPYLKAPHNRTQEQVYRTQEQTYLEIQTARRFFGLPTDAIEEQLKHLLKLQKQAR